MVALEPPEVTLVGANDTVVPAGMPVASRLTLCAWPEVIVAEMALVPAWPCATETLPGLAASAKSLGGAVTVRPRSWLWLADAVVPVTCTVYEPGVVPAPAFRVSVALEPALTVDDGVKLAVVPAGRPVADRAMVCAPPETMAVAIVTGPLAPPWTA